jgi:hypothetical protein
MQKAELELHDIKDIVNTLEWRWKRWDVRSDGRVFWQYTTKTTSGEWWINWDSAIKLQESLKKAAAKQRAKNPEKHKLLNRQWREANKEKHRRNASDYYQRNREHANEVKRKRRLERRHSDQLYAFRENIRNLVRQSFRDRNYTKSSKAQLIIGCDWVALKNHIEAQFTDGMSWANRGKWHVDHIVPLASAKTIEDVVRLNHYTNLRPLWALDNLKKGARISQNTPHFTAKLPIWHI